MIETDLSTYLDELQHKLAVARGVHVSVAAINPILSRMGLTRKVVSQRASERNDSVLVLWELRMAQYTDPGMFVFIDESALGGLTVQMVGPLPIPQSSKKARSFEVSITLSATFLHSFYPLDTDSNFTTNSRFLQ